MDTGTTTRAFPSWPVLAHQRRLAKCTITVLPGTRAAVAGELSCLASRTPHRRYGNGSPHYSVLLILPSYLENISNAVRLGEGVCHAKYSLQENGEIRWRRSVAGPVGVPARRLSGPFKKLLGLRSPRRHRRLHCSRPQRSYPQ